MWDSLPDAVKVNCNAVKEKLKEAFGRKLFQSDSQPAHLPHPEQHGRVLESYAAEISWLVVEAFPKYGDRALRKEKFRCFMAGLDPVLRTNCYKQGATDMEKAVIIAGWSENARS